MEDPPTPPGTRRFFRAAGVAAAALPCVFAGTLLFAVIAFPSWARTELALGVMIATLAATPGCVAAVLTGGRCVAAARRAGSPLPPSASAFRALGLGLLAVALPAVTAGAALTGWRRAVIWGTTEGDPLFWLGDSLTWAVGAQAIAAAVLAALPALTPRRPAFGPLRGLSCVLLCLHLAKATCGAAWAAHLAADAAGLLPDRVDDALHALLALPMSALGFLPFADLLGLVLFFVALPALLRSAEPPAARARPTRSAGRRLRHSRR